MTDLSHLNPQQLAAVTHTDSCLVIAGPGTGKTHTLVARLDYLLTEKQVPPHQILALTFTKKAAREMKNRLSSVALAKEEPFIDTLHAWCYWYLKNHHPDWQIHPKTIISEAEQKGIIRSLKHSGDKVDDLINQISKLKQTDNSELSSSRTRGSMAGLTKEIEYQVSGVTWPIDSHFHGTDILNAYQNYLLTHHLLDFDDLLIDTFNLLQNPNITKPAYQHTLIDELQDFTTLQFQIIQQLISSQTQVFIVGDPYQSIYGFRGAAPNLVDQLTILNLEKITLTQNYRSHQVILDSSSSLFDPPRSLQALEANGPSIQLLQTADEKTEAYWISKTIQQLTGSYDPNINSPSDLSQIHFADIAILYRSHNLSQPLQLQLSKDSVPRQIIGEKTLLEYSDISTVLEKLKILNLNNLDAGVHNLSELLTYIYQQSHLHQTQPALQRLQLLKTLAHQYGNDLNLETINLFLEELKFYQDSDTFQTGADKVTLSTIHAAKGLEFHTVFIVGVEEKLLPFHKSLDDPEQIDEEKRLFYVALTRAKHQVILTTTKHRYIHDKSETSKPSRFLKLLSSQHIQTVEDQFAIKYAHHLHKLRQKRRQLSLL